jgi:hypothetical protein
MNQQRIQSIAAGSPASPEEARELWRDVLGWEGKYQVSSLGEIRHASGKQVGQWKSSQGYALARLSSPRATVRVHRIVAAAFIQNPLQKPAINHIDCNRSNNKAENLEWCTQTENLRHSHRLGRMQKDYWTGKRSPSAVLSDDQVKTMRIMYETGRWSFSQLGEVFGVSKRCVGRAISGETYRDLVAKLPLPAAPNKEN